MNEQVRSVMTLDPIVVSPGDNVKDVSDMMLEKRMQQFPVVENGKLVGLITSYDLWRNLRDSADGESKSVADVMTTNIIKITPLDKVGTAAELFMDKRFKSLPVVNLRDELKGVITAFDVIKYSLRKEYDEPILYREVIEGQSQPSTST